MPRVLPVADRCIAAFHAADGQVVEICFGQESGRRYSEVSTPAGVKRLNRAP
jgi:hypothetical protein